MIQLPPFPPVPIPSIPTFAAGRVILAPFTLADAPLVREYAGHPEIARTTLNVPHPYPEGVAEKWIASHLSQFLEHRSIVFSIRAPSDHALLGTVGLSLDMPNQTAELGYWVARPFWGRGFATDAVRSLIAYAFASHPLDKISARHLGGNPASGRVMQKSGMTLELTLHQHVIKNGKLHDIIHYGILRSTMPPALLSNTATPHPA